MEGICVARDLKCAFVFEFAEMGFCVISQVGVNGTSRSGLMRKMENGERNLLLSYMFLKTPFFKC